jgi:hypothetical protein
MRRRRPPASLTPWTPGWFLGEHYLVGLGNQGIGIFGTMADGTRAAPEGTLNGEKNRLTFAFKQPGIGVTGSIGVRCQWAPLSKRCHRASPCHVPFGIDRHRFYPTQTDCAPRGTD